MNEPSRSRERAEPGAFDRALKLLSTRAHFREELRRKLLRKGHEEVEVETALERLAAMGQLDDGRLATEEAARLRERKGLARRGVAAELRRKGAAGEAVDAAVSEGGEPEEERSRALETARRWLRTHRKDASALARHLDRKGYGRGEIVGAILTLGIGGEVPEEGDQ